MKLNEIGKLIASILICQMAGVVGSVFTMPAITGWYSGLVKPAWVPPNWVFGPVWITLYTLMGIALFLVWTKGFKDKPSKTALKVFSAQLFLNAVWSLAFFGLHSPLLGLVVIVPLWFLILLTIVKFHKLSKGAAYLLVPYLIWVTIATALNASVWLLNP